MRKSSPPCATDAKTSRQVGLNSGVHIPQAGDQYIHRSLSCLPATVWRSTLPLLEQSLLFELGPIIQDRSGRGISRRTHLDFQTFLSHSTSSRWLWWGRWESGRLWMPRDWAWTLHKPFWTADQSFPSQEVAMWLHHLVASLIVHSRQLDDLRLSCYVVDRLMRSFTYVGGDVLQALFSHCFSCIMWRRLASKDFSRRSERTWVTLWYGEGTNPMIEQKVDLIIAYHE